MLRDKNLIPLSHQHQRALALCVRLDRAWPIPNSDLNTWQAEIAQLFRTEIEIHFAAEERVLFEEACGFPELKALVEELSGEHATLREYFHSAEARGMSVEALSEFAKGLAAHIRKEERLLFERMQALMTQEDLATLGHALEDALKDASQVCVVPSDATKLRAKPR
jgi:hemerythrin